MAAKGDDSITAVPEGSEAYQDAIALELRETPSQDERED
jgi:hypothetical protein